MTRQRQRVAPDTDGLEVFVNGTEEIEVYPKYCPEEHHYGNKYDCMNCDLRGRKPCQYQTRSEPAESIIYGGRK